MLHRKNADDQPSVEEQALHQRVYDMMELDRSKQAEAAKNADEKLAPPPVVTEPAEEISAPEPVANTTTAEPLDIFKGLNKDSPITPVEPPVVAEPELPVEKPEASAQEVVDIYDDAIDKVIDEIVVSESDALLAAEDLAAKLKTLPPKSKPKLGHLFKK